MTVLSRFMSNVRHLFPGPYRAAPLVTALMMLACGVSVSAPPPAHSQTEIAPSIAPGTVVNRFEIPDGRFLQYSRGRIFWGKHVLVVWRTVRPNTETVPRPLPGDRVMYVRRGSVTALLDDEKLGLRENDLVYHEQGAVSAVLADDVTAEIMEFHWPVHPGHLREGGGKAPDGYVPPKPSSRPAIPPGRIFNLAYLQYCMPAENTLSKVVQGYYGQVNFVRIEPGAECPETSLPHEQILIVLRGALDVVMAGETSRLSVEDIFYIPAGAAFGMRTGYDGCDFIAVFSPADDRYEAALMERVRLFHSVIPPFAEPELVCDGRFGGPMLGFTEGPNWLDGRLLFSDQHYGGLYTLDPAGGLTVLRDDIVPCGTALLPAGTIAVCDIRAKTVIEVTRDGATVGTLADSFDGEPFAGTPNDVISDRKGGIYFSTTSFSARERSNVVFYRSPNGTVAPVTGWGEFGFPNGIALSPDGSTLYLDDDTSRFVWAFDVQPDGALANKRRFASLIMHETQIGAPRPKSFADGMTVDAEGNLYVAASGFIQIFSQEGVYRGGFVFPKPSFHCAFGGPDRSTLYVTCMNQVYSLPTKMKGLSYPPK